MSDLPRTETSEPKVVVQRNTGTKAVLILVTVALLALLALLAVLWLPRWWAFRVGDVVDQRPSNGIFAGLVCGFVFTAVPLMLLRRVFTFRSSSIGARVIWLILAAVFAAPNLTTMGIALGTGSTAHAAQRVLDTEAPAFRTSTLLGAILAVIFVLGLWAALGSRRRRNRKLTELKTQAAEREAQVREAKEEARLAQEQAAKVAREAEQTRGTTHNGFETPTADRADRPPA